MPETNSTARAKRLVLFVVLIMGTILHGCSVAHIYLPALIRARAVLVMIVK